MKMDAQHLQVPETPLTNPASQTELSERLAQARLLPDSDGLLETLSLAARLNRCAMTLLERQRALQSLAEQYRHYVASAGDDEHLSRLFLQLSDELASGFKRLLLQVLQGHKPSHPHLTWCLYMAQHFLAHTLMRHYQHYQEPPAHLWRDSHLLYWLGEQHACLDDQVAAAFRPVAANSLRALYQQMLLMALSDPFHLTGRECAQLFSALAPVAGNARLIEWDVDDDREGPLIDLRLGCAYLPYPEKPTDSSPHARRLELGALMLAVEEPAPLRSHTEQVLLNRVISHWQRTEQRSHPRTPQNSGCKLAIGLLPIHAQLLEKRPACATARMLDSSAGGARLVCTGDATHLQVGQLVLLMGDASTLAMVCWLHRNDQGMHLGLRYLKGQAKAAWLRRTPSAQAHPAVLQSTPNPGQGWHHGLWITRDQFQEMEKLWLQLAQSHSQTTLLLANANLGSPLVSRHRLELD